MEGGYRVRAEGLNDGREDRVEEKQTNINILYLYSSLSSCFQVCFYLNPYFRLRMDLHPSGVPSNTV